MTPEEYYKKGDEASKNGDYEKAVEYMKRAIEARYQYAEAHNYLGWLLGKLGDYDGAIKEYKVALQQKPFYPHAHYNLGYEYYFQGDYDSAIKEFRTAIEQKSGACPDYHYQLALALEMVGLFDESLTEYEFSLRQEINEKYVDECIAAINRVKKKKAVLGPTSSSKQGPGGII